MVSVPYLLKGYYPVILYTVIHRKPVWMEDTVETDYRFINIPYAYIYNILILKMCVYSKKGVRRTGPQNYQIFFNNGINKVFQVS